MTAYIVVHMDYQDPALIQEYQRLASPTLGQYGVRVLGKTLDASPLEGTTPGRLTVLLAAESASEAERWFNSPEYQRAADARRPVSHFVATVVPAS